MTTRLDCIVEKDCSAALDKSRLIWISSHELAEELDRGEPLLLDTRSYSSYNTMHIKTAHSLSFSPMLMRRMNRKTIVLDSLITDQTLLEMMDKATQIIFYDSNSMPLDAKKEIHTFADMLLARFGEGLCLKALIGEFINPVKTDSVYLPMQSNSFTLLCFHRRNGYV